MTRTPSPCRASSVVDTEEATGHEPSPDQRQTSSAGPERTTRPGVEDHDGVGQRERLVEVVGHEQCRDRPPLRRIRWRSARSAARGVRGPQTASGSSSMRSRGDGCEGAGQGRRAVARRRTTRPRRGARRRRGPRDRASPRPGRAVRRRPTTDGCAGRTHVGRDVLVAEQRVVLEHQPEVPAVGRGGREIGPVPGHRARGDAARARRRRGAGSSSRCRSGPMIARISPSATLRSRPATARTVP